jgi:8-oxo-dGTP pyrophosphatase MutT (NUDIX family)
MESVLYSTPFLAVLDRDGYTFVREIRCNGNIVSVLPVRTMKNGRQYLARRETCPAHSEIEAQPELCSITGGVDPGRSPLETAQLELFEEAGYEVDAKKFIALGTVRPSKAMDTVAHLFAVDVTTITPQEAKGDGSKWEMGSSVEWIRPSKALEIGDPLFIATLARLQKGVVPRR